MAAPVDIEIRPAATVMVVRDAPGPVTGTALEVLMVRRNLRSDFVGGAYVFPGGAVDPLDAGSEAEALCDGRSDAEASALLGLASGGLAYWVAAVRETFEEAGLLLAHRTAGSQRLGGDAREATRIDAARASVNAGTRPFLDLCKEEHLRLDVGDIHYFAHWIAPRGTPRRYDTRFFVAGAPRGQVAAPSADGDEGETVAHVWIAPAEALARHRAGVIQIVVPTVRNLQAISRFATAAALLDAAAASSRAVPVVEPRVVADGNGVRIVLPGDPGFEMVTAPAALDPSVEDFNEAMRVAALRVNREVTGPDREPGSARS